MGPTETEPTAPTPTARTGPTETARTAPPETRLTGLAAFLGAEEAGRLLSGPFGRDRHVSRIDPARGRELFGWPRLNAVLAEHRLTPPRLRLERAGGDVTAGLFRNRRTRRGAQLQDLDPVVLTERLREGATLIVDAVNELSPPLAALCSGLATEFAASCQANLYACWGKTQGFDVHWDDHEVFVLQLEGRKAWSLYGATETAPTRRGGAVPAERPTRAREELVLEPGDVLYLPRGYWHAAVGLGEPSLHLTIGLTRKTGADLLHWLADEAMASALVRADLPFEAGEAALAARIGELLADLSARDPAELARRYRRSVESLLVQRPQLSFPYIGAEEAELAPQQRLRLGHGPARLESRGDDLVLHWRGVAFSLSPALAEPLARLVAGETVSLAELRDAVPASPPAEVQDLVRTLARRGTLVIAQGE
jgi:hypothetical protein